MRNLFVQTHSNGWEIKWERVERSSSTHSTKLEAIYYAKALAKNNATATNPISLKIKKLDGTIEIEYSYPKNADPFPPKG